jgi:hypothetical protein
MGNNIDHQGILSIQLTASDRKQPHHLDQYTTAHYSQRPPLLISHSSGIRPALGSHLPAGLLNHI